MTLHVDVARGRNVVARWCNLAEQRLEYLTELFETGRWRRFHSERAFLENIQEAKTAVGIWRDLSLREASRDNRRQFWRGSVAPARACRAAKPCTISLDRFSRSRRWRTQRRAKFRSPPKLIAFVRSKRLPRRRSTRRSRARRQ